MLCRPESLELKAARAVQAKRRRYRRKGQTKRMAGRMGMYERNDLLPSIEQVRPTVSTLALETSGQRSGPSLHGVHFDLMKNIV